MPSAIQLKPRIQRFSNPSWHCALLNVFKDLNKGLIPFQRDETTFKRAKFEGPSRLKLIKIFLIQICLCEGKYLVLFHDGGFIVKKKQKKLFLKQTKLKLEQNKIKAQTIIDYLPTYQKIFSVPNLSKNLWYLLENCLNCDWWWVPCFHKMGHWLTSEHLGSCTTTTCN